MDNYSNYKIYDNFKENPIFCPFCDGMKVKIYSHESDEEEGMMVFYKYYCKDCKREFTNKDL